jgi:hypothetical protein
VHVLHDDHLLAVGQLLVADRLRSLRRRLLVAVRLVDHDPVVRRRLRHHGAGRVGMVGRRRVFLAAGER